MGSVAVGLYDRRASGAQLGSLKSEQAAACAAGSKVQCNLMHWRSPVWGGRVPAAAQSSAGPSRRATAAAPQQHLLPALLQAWDWPASLTLHTKLLHVGMQGAQAVRCAFATALHALNALSSAPPPPTSTPRTPAPHPPAEVANAKSQGGPTVNAYAAYFKVIRLKCHQ